jgi:hypothetical protein
MACASGVLSVCPSRESALPDRKRVFVERCVTVRGLVNAAQYNGELVQRGAMMVRNGPLLISTAAAFIVSVSAGRRGPVARRPRWQGAQLKPDNLEAVTDPAPEAAGSGAAAVVSQQQEGVRACSVCGGPESKFKSAAVRARRWERRDGSGAPTRRSTASSIDMYNNDVGKRFMK